MAKKKSKECDCLDKVAKEVLKKLSSSNDTPNGYKVVESGYENKSFYPKERLFTRFVVTSTSEKKDGSTSRPKRDFISIFFSYCPFCGKEL